MSTAIVLFSGGQDSTVCLHYALQHYKRVLPITIVYGQAHAIELLSVQKICEMNYLVQETINLGFGILRGGTLLSDMSMAQGEIADTWVPYRNMLFLTIALNRAIKWRDSVVIIGVNSVDYSGYPDCRGEFIDSIIKTGFLASETYIPIETPLLHLSKSEIVQLGRALPGCMESLAWSHTCYKGSVPPCGECPACVLREKGFADAGVPDPLIERLKNA